MASVNKVILVGYLGRDPEVRYNPDGLTVANISLATTFAWNDKNTGSRREETEWHRVVFYNRQAEIVGQYLRKGSQVYVEGRLRTRKWQDQQGIERYTTEIIADTMQMLGGNSSDGQNNSQSGYSNTQSFESTTPPPRANTQRQANAYAQATGGTARKAPPPSPQQGIADMDDDVPF